jgi:hypothetical protein
MMDWISIASAARQGRETGEAGQFILSVTWPIGRLRGR